MSPSVADYWGHCQTLWSFSKHVQLLTCCPESWHAVIDGMLVLTVGVLPGMAANELRNSGDGDEDDDCGHDDVEDGCNDDDYNDDDDNCR